MTILESWDQLTELAKCAMVEWKVMGHDLDEETGEVIEKDGTRRPARNFMENARAAQPVADVLKASGWRILVEPCARGTLSLVTLDKGDDLIQVPAAPAHKAIVRAALIAAGVIHG